MSTTVFSGGAVAHVFAAHPIEPDRQPGSGRCHLAVTMAEHARPMTHMLRASRRAERARRTESYRRCRATPVTPLLPATRPQPNTRSRSYSSDAPHALEVAAPVGAVLVGYGRIGEVRVHAAEPEGARAPTSSTARSARPRSRRRRSQPRRRPSARAGRARRGVEGGGVRRHAVIGAAPGHEVELPRLPWPASPDEELHQCLDRAGRQRLAEESDFMYGRPCSSSGRPGLAPEVVLQRAVRMCARSDEAASSPATDTNSSSSAAVSVAADHRAEQVDQGRRGPPRRR